MKDYTLNHTIKAPRIFKVYSIIKGYWVLWGAPEPERINMSPSTANFPDISRTMSVRV